MRIDSTIGAGVSIEIFRLTCQPRSPDEFQNVAIGIVRI